MYVVDQPTRHVRPKQGSQPAYVSFEFNVVLPAFRRRGKLKLDVFSVNVYPSELDHPIFSVSRDPKANYGETVYSFSSSYDYRQIETHHAYARRGLSLPDKLALLKRDLNNPAVVEAAREFIAAYPQVLVRMDRALDRICPKSTVARLVAEAHRRRELDKVFKRAIKKQSPGLPPPLPMLAAAC